MRHLLTGVHPLYVVAVFVVYAGELIVHLTLRVECLDDAQSSEGFLDNTHRVAPQRLCLHGVLLQFSAYITHEPSHQRHEDDGEQRQLPGDDDQCGEVGYDEDRVLEEHVETRHYRALNLLDVTTHAGNDITLALLGEEAQRQRRNLLVQLVADVTYNTRADRNYRRRRKEVSSRLEECGEGEEQSYQQQRRRGAHINNKLLNVVVHVVAQRLLKVALSPRS